MLRLTFVGYVRHSCGCWQRNYCYRYTSRLTLEYQTLTTSLALTAALHYLLRTPDKFDILRREIRSTFKTVDEITVNSTARLNYLTATINEALRLAPPAPTFLPRLVPNGGANICDTWVPGGVS